MKEASDISDRLDFWVDKITKSLGEHVELSLQAHPEMTKDEAKDLYFINKIATLTVGMEELGKQLRSIKQEVNQIKESQIKKSK